MKFARYERYGVPSYWVVDPERLSLIAWELRGGRYVEEADVGSGHARTARRPCEVTVDPGRLRD